MKLYTALAEWWPLLSHPDEYRDEAAWYWGLMRRHARRPIESLLELGSGGGNNAFHIRRHAASEQQGGTASPAPLRMTLTDLSAAMLDVSRRLNPECEHVQGDMRTLRLQRRFDAVFIHDAVMYMNTADDLRSALRTAWEHCAPGGVLLVAPDCTRETWTAGTSHGGRDGASMSLRYLEWTWDPDPADSQYVVQFAFLLRSADGAVRIEHEQHRFGLFAQREWIEFLTQAGFTARIEPGGDGDDGCSRCFVGVREA